MNAPMKQESARQESIRFSRIFHAAGAKQPPAPARRASTTAASFIVRATRGPFGELTGVIERVATGQEERFVGCEAVGAVISEMLAGEDRA